MSYNYTLYTHNHIGDSNSKSPTTSTTTPARVIDVILDSSHPEWAKFGKSQSIGAIKYALINKNIDTEDPENLPVAYPLVNDFKKLPLKNEIVLLVDAPGDKLFENKNNTKIYYHTVVNLWNHPNHGGYPEDNVDLDLGKDIDELTDVNPLQPFPGDIILDGRQGQSLRFTGFIHKDNPLVDNRNNGKPLTILSNGQKSAPNSFDTIVEDINEDASSIYLTSDHKVPLKQVNTYTESYGLNKKPFEANEYRGSQVVLNGGRLFFNAKDEGIFLNSKKYIGLQSEYINLDSKKEISLDSELIFLGKEAANAPQSFREPVLKGNTTVSLINSFLTIVEGMASSMKTCRDGEGKKIIILNKRGRKAQKQIRSLKKSTGFGSSPLKSKKIFTE